MPQKLREVRQRPCESCNLDKQGVRRGRMARGKRKKLADQNSKSDGRVPADEKVARLLGLLLVKDIKKKTDKVPMLRAAGFQVSEVAHMLGMTENHVRVADHLGQKKKKSD